MSLNSLTVGEVEALFEGHGFYRPSYEERKKVKTGSGYYDYRWEKTGQIIPERYETIADGKASWHEYEELPDEGITVERLGQVFLEKQHGGEGQGDDYYIILRVEDSSSGAPNVVRYFKKHGWHASHDGSYLDGALTEVKPMTREVVFYE